MYNPSDGTIEHYREPNPEMIEKRQVYQYIKERTFIEIVLTSMVYEEEISKKLKDSKDLAFLPTSYVMTRPVMNTLYHVSFHIFRNISLKKDKNNSNVTTIRTNTVHAHEPGSNELMNCLKSSVRLKRTV